MARKLSRISRATGRNHAAREGAMFRKESQPEHAFFSSFNGTAFFKPATAFGFGQLIQPKCEECEKEEKVQKAEKKEEEKPIQKKSHKDDEDEPIQMKSDRDDKDERIQKIGLKVEEEEKVQKQEAVEPEEEVITFTPTFSERGVEEQNTRHYANCEGVTVQGHTDANYGNSFTAPGQSSRGRGCTDCSGEECITNTGTVISVFTANPQITLPPVPSGLNECEQQAVQNFINTTLLAHEQLHVAAFNTYRGTVRTPYTYRGCASGLDAHTQQIHDNTEAARKTQSDAASAALDANGANNFTVTCNCPDPEPENGNTE